MIKDHKDKIALVTGSSRGLGKYLSIELITGHTTNQFKKKIQEKVNNKKIDLVIGTHSLFQKKIDGAPWDKIVAGRFPRPPTY